MVAVAAGNERMGFWKTMFNLKDDSRERVKKAVAESAAQREIAASNLEATIRDLLETNDRVTGRVRAHDQIHE